MMMMMMMMMIFFILCGHIGGMRKCTLFCLLGPVKQMSLVFKEFSLPGRVALKGYGKLESLSLQSSRY